MSSPLSAFNFKTQNQIAAILQAENDRKANRTPAAPVPVPQGKTIRQKQGDGMNKLERAFLEQLKAFNPKGYIYREISLPIANGSRYKVDFTLAADGGVWAYEVKGGHVWDDAIVKLKVAATLYPWITFQLVTRRQGVWQYQRIFP